MGTGEGIGLHSVGNKVHGWVWALWIGAYDIDYNAHACLFILPPLLLYRTHASTSPMQRL